MPGILKDKFHTAMLNNYEDAKKITLHRFSAFKKMIEQHGGVEAAKILVKNMTPSSGFITLCTPSFKSKIFCRIFSNSGRI